MRTMTLFAAALALGLAFIGAGEVTAASACFANLASGSGATALTVCLSDHGNIVKWITPAGVEHSTQNDGYVLCSLGAAAPVVHGWDAGFIEDGFGPSIIDQPNGANTLPLVITRTTDDGVFQLEQRFTRDATEKDLTIAMTVRNIGRATRDRVQLGRYFGMSPNKQNNSPNNASVTTDSVFLWDDPHQPFVDAPHLVYGVMLTALSYNITHKPVVEDHDAWNPYDDDGPMRAKSCSPLDFGGPRIDLLDLRGRVTYELGAIAPGKNRRANFLYRHM